MPLNIVGKRIPRVDAVEKATGGAKFLDDYSFSNMLIGKILRSPYPHAKILNIDTSRALKLPGVKAIVTAGDLPEGRYGAYVKDQPVLARGRVRFVGEPVAVVAAIDEDVAKDALKLITVEYEELQPVFDPIEAMASDAPIIHEKLQDYIAVYDAVRYGNVCSKITFKEGNIDEGFSKSDFVLENTFKTPHVHQCYLETWGAIADWDASGRITIWTTTQSPHVTQIRTSEALHIPMNKIRVIGTRVGGGFGGKVEPTVQPICVVVAKKAKRPVKIVLDREEDLLATRPRHASQVKIKDGVTKNGLLMARSIEVIYDTGAFADDGPGVAGFGAMMSLGPYKIPNYHIDSYAVYTNKLPTGAYRGFGNPQVTFAYESHMDMLAGKIGMDPLELRIKNACENGDKSVGGIVMPSVGIKECLRKAAETAGWGKHPKKNRGMGIASLQHISGVLSSSAIVRINEDGTAMVSTGAVDIGQGSDTALTQIAAEGLELPFEDVTLIAADTASTPYNWAVAASRVTYTAGNAIKIAADDAKRQLLELASKQLGAAVEQLFIKERKVISRETPEKCISIRDLGAISHWVTGGPIIGKGSFMVEGHKHDPEKVKGFPFGTMAGFIFGAHVVEVEVDEETGNVQIINAVAAHDVGKAVNPIGVEGQINGGFVQGVGYALTEEMIFDKNGKVVNTNFLDYKIPTFMDVPMIHPLIVEEKDPTGPFGAKGVGEPGLVATAPAIANAIYNAIGIRFKELPMKPEKIWKALLEKEK